MKVDAWMPLWIGEYLADTTHLSRDLHGGYLLLLMAYWRNKGPLVDRGDALANIVKATPSEWRRRLRPVLAEFFDVDGDVWRHGRADRELAAAESRQTAAASKAKSAAEARWKPCHKHAPSSPQAVRKECPPPSPVVTEEQREQQSQALALALVEVRKAFPLAEATADLQALLGQGATPAELGAVAREAADKGKGWPWFVAAVVGRRRDAAALVLVAAPEKPWHETRSGIVAKGIELGIGGWSEDDWTSGRAPQWPTYQARVYEAAGYQPPRAAA